MAGHIAVITVLFAASVVLDIEGVYVRSGDNFDGGYFYPCRDRTVGLFVYF